MHEEECNVLEELFPCVGKCCSESTGLIGNPYKNICKYCSVWTSLPDRVSLEITAIFECSRLGYGKRIKK